MSEGLVNNDRKEKHSMELISVIVAVHNGETYLADCLDSILRSSFENLEVIVVENASTDATLAICRAYEAKYDKVRVLTTSVPGVSHARNMGMEVAQGAYLTFVDADDYVSPDMYAKMYACATEQHSDMVLCDYVRGAEPHYQFPACNGVREEINPSEYCYRLYMKGMMAYCLVWNKLFRREVAQGVLFDESLRYAEDRNWVQKIMCKSQHICYLKEPLYYYRLNPSSVCLSGSQKTRMDQIHSLQKDLAFFESQYPDKKLWQECVTACLLQNADFRLRRAKKEGMKDIQAELKPIVKETAGRLRRAEQLSRRDKYRFLLEHDCLPLFRLAARITGH
jgi:glycosyltransferase involved in cell wall biosynthesis